MFAMEMDMCTTFHLRAFKEQVSSVWDLKSTRKIFFYKKNNFLIFNFIMKKKKKSNIIKIS